MSYNVRLFNLYNWIEDIEADTEILKLISRESPDVLCLQEFYSNAHNQYDYLKQVMKAGGYKKYYCPGYKNGKHYGSAIFSRFPIKKHGTFTCENSNNTFLFADIEVYGTTIRFYSLHLASLYLNDDDYKFIDQIADNEKNKAIKAVSGILSKLRYAYEKRLAESAVILKHAQNCKLPVVLCGDFNDVPVSYVYRTFGRHFKDAFREAGFGVGHTYERRFMRFRIDYIFVSRQLKVLNYSALDDKFSDHYPIESIIGFDIQAK